MSNENPSGFRRFLNFIFNFFWVIFCGLEMALTYIFEGIFSVLLIVPIFFGIPGVYFKFVPLVFAPAGKTVELHFEDAIFRNIIYLLFGGFVNVIMNYTLGALLMVTIIGIPLGLQVFKMAKYSIAPFGVKILKYGVEI